MTERKKLEHQRVVDMQKKFDAEAPRSILGDGFEQSATPAGRNTAYSSASYTSSYDSVDSRRQTYVGKEQRFDIPVERLARAGFIFDDTTNGDQVKCFWCNGYLNAWTKDDDPWREHAKFFPLCSYLRMKKGAKYILDIYNGTTAEDKETIDSLIYNKGDTSLLRDVKYFKETERRRSIEVIPGWAGKAAELAKRGFYCAGSGSRMICYFCGLIILPPAVNEDVFQLHKEMSPNCCLLSQTDENDGNIPFGFYRQNDVLEMYRSYYCMQCQRQYPYQLAERCILCECDMIKCVFTNDIIPEQPQDDDDVDDESYY